MLILETNPYLLWGAWQLMGVSATMYIVVNIREQCALFPNASGISLGLINGFFDASGNNEQEAFFIKRIQLASSLLLNSSTTRIFRTWQYHRCSLTILWESASSGSNSFYSVLALMLKKKITTLFYQTRSSEASANAQRLRLPRKKWKKPSQSLGRSTKNPFSVSTSCSSIYSRSSVPWESHLFKSGFSHG